MISHVYTGETSITVFSLLGFWRPSELKTKWIINLYQIYSKFIIIIQTTFIFTLLIYFKDVWQNTESFVLNSLYFFSLLGNVVKQLTIILKRNVIIDIQERLLDKVCQPRDSYETEILQKQSRICRLNEKIFLVLFNVTALIVVVTPLVKGSDFSLPIPVWCPYSLESKTKFCLTYLFQSIIIMVSACSTAAMEGLLLTCALQICSQLDLLFHRFDLLPHLTKNIGSYSDVCLAETRSIGDCTKHHNHIYLLGHQLNNLFGVVIFFQFFWSMISLCAVVYELINLNLNNSAYWMMLFIGISLLLQTFLYCFYGEMIIQKSTEVTYAIQKMNWIVLTNGAKKDLLVVMLRAAQPIELHDFTAVVMSLKTFMNIVKSAYSAYNLLNNGFN